MGARLFYDVGADLDQPAKSAYQHKYLRYERSGLLKIYTLFEQVAKREDRLKMDELRKELKSLGPNPLDYLSERFDLGRKISELKLKVGSTVTAEGFDFMTALEKD